jgi:hypothetical protein
MLAQEEAEAKAVAVGHLGRDGLECFEVLLHDRSLPGGDQFVVEGIDIALTAIELVVGNHIDVDVEGLTIACFDPGPGMFVGQLAELRCRFLPNELGGLFDGPDFRRREFVGARALTAQLKAGGEPRALREHGE